MIRTLKALRQTLSAVLVGLTLVFGLLVSPFAAPAQAASLTPEANQYNSDGNTSNTASGLRLDARNAKQNARQNAEEAGGFVGAIKGAAENVTEKLNLNEPLPESTKDFIDSVKGEGDNNAVDSTRQGLGEAASFPKGGYSR